MQTQKVCRAVSGCVNWRFKFSLEEMSQLILFLMEHKRHFSEMTSVCFSQQRQNQINTTYLIYICCQRKRCWCKRLRSLLPRYVSKYFKKMIFVQHLNITLIHSLHKLIWNPALLSRLRPKWAYCGCIGIYLFAVCRKITNTRCRHQNTKYMSKGI